MSSEPHPTDSRQSDSSQPHVGGWSRIRACARRHRKAVAGGVAAATFCICIATVPEPVTAITAIYLADIAGKATDSLLRGEAPSTD